MNAKTIKIAGRSIGLAHPPLVVAEIGINHNGSLQTAKEMALAAIKAGAEVIKHQTHIPEDEMSAEAKKMIPGNASCSIWDIMSRCALNEEEETELQQFVLQHGAIFISTPFSFQAVERLEKMGVPAYKVGSGEMNNLPLLDYIARTQKPILLSTGMNDLDSVRRSVDVIVKHHTEFALLHTTNVYPTPAPLIRLGALEELKTAFPGEVIGLSDHSQNNLACLAAVALGASVLERHFTDTKTRPGEDICCSMTPQELRDLISQSKEIAQMRGGRKSPAKEESVTIQFAFSSVVAARDLAPGQTITRADLTAKRPAGGIAAADLPKLIGKKAACALHAGQQLTWKDVL